MLRQGQLKPGAPISERPAGPLTAQCLAVPGRRAMNFFVGLDWASQAHAVCVLDATGQVCWQGSVEHRSEEHTSELQSQSNLVCRLLLEKKKKRKRVKHSAQRR